jgi:N-acetylglucosaminyldiphosphoundecaprenol N-acetyl-beta-D-mannosaminyltransferase
VRPVPSTRVGGVAVDAVTIDDTVDMVRQWVEIGEPRVAVGINAHVVNQAGRDPHLAALLERADLSYADGQSVVWASRLGDVRLPERVATTDLAHPLAAMCAAQGLRLYCFGGRPGVADEAARRLRESHAGLKVQAHHGYVPADEVTALLDEIRSFAPDVLLVGLGDPAQQHWAQTHARTTGACAILTCGGLFDWVSGNNRRPPGWMVRWGLEWLWRVFLEPRRLLRRYIVGNPEFVWRVLVARWRAAGQESASA